MQFYFVINPAFPKWKRQMLRTMKITAFLIMISFLTVSAATFAQKITLKEQHASLEQVLDKIRQQSGLDIVYSNDLLSKATPVTVDFKNADLEEALKLCLNGQPLTFDIEDGTVVIKQKEETLLDKARAFFVQVTVSGFVKDETGQPMAGVSVKIKGTDRATSTDDKGKFTITVPDDKTVIQFSYIGYEPQEYQAKDIATGSTITLKATQTNLKEVVVSKGYYDEKKELLTGDVSVVNSKVISEQPVSDPILALEGRVPGIQITQASGLPGSSVSILIRGRNSIANGTNPLVIVDGVPYPSTTLSNLGNSSPGGLSPFNNLNPADIDDIEILKDADATSIYGSRGANGVILITTKKGHAGQTEVNLNLSSGQGKVTRMLPLLNTTQYLQMRREAFKNDGLPVPSLTTDPNNTDYDINGTWDTTRYTNWEKLLIGNTSHFNTANVSVSGGNTNTQFLLGGSFSDQTTVFPGSYQDKKASFHASLTHTSTNQKFHLQFSTQYVNDDNLIPEEDFTRLIILAPDAPRIYNPDGSINWANGTFRNPFASTLASSTSSTSNLVSSLNLAYDLLPGLKIQSSFGYTRSDINESNQTPETAFYTPSTNNNTLSLGQGVNKTWIIEPQISYDKKLGKGHFNLLIGSSLQQLTSDIAAFYGYGFSSPALLGSISNASNIFPLFSPISNYKYIAAYARLNYSWDDKYVVNLTANRDGSSRFGPGNQFGNFGAAGVAWIFSKEQAIANSFSFLSLGKLRASYGTVGNDQIGDYQYLSVYGPTGNYQNVSGLSPVGIASPYYAWEVDKKFETGIELGFFQNRIDVNASYVRNRTGNQLVGQPLPSQDGFQRVQANLPAIVQNTSFEVELNSQNIKSGNFTWSTSFNLTVPRNTLVSFPGLSTSIYAGSYAIGKSLSTRSLYTVTGVDPQTGKYTYLDVNGDGSINQLDKQFSRAIAQNFYGGLGNSFTYKSFQLDVFFQFVKQTGQNYLTAGFIPPGYFIAESANQPVLVLNRWQKAGDQTQTAKFSTNLSEDPQYDIVQSTYTISDASFIRLKNVHLSYMLPQSWQNRLSMHNAKIYIEGQNLITITGYKGLDPESQGLALPPLRMIVLGVQASF